ncbi:Uncharacterised protein [Mycobacteroides abscessus subsp. abscessus]|nr:Uncharacterised protein [Mycobacteroides abscessus subsp. abscessus]
MVSAPGLSQSKSASVHCLALILPRTFSKNSSFLAMSLVLSLVSSSGSTAVIGLPLTSRN